MFNAVQIEKLISKLERYIEVLNNRRYDKILNINVKKFETFKQYNIVPKDDKFYKKIKEGDTWGGEQKYCWFKGNVRIPDKYINEDLYIYPDVGGYEGFLFINNIPKGIFATKNSNHGISLHEYCLFKKSKSNDNNIEFAIEFYAGMYYSGKHPFEKNKKYSYRYTYNGIYLYTKNQDIVDFILDLNTLIQLVNNISKKSFRNAQIVNCLLEVHKLIYYDIEEIDEKIWRKRLLKARSVMAKTLNSKNPNSAPLAGITGHSHLDTAWLWPLDVTLKKCARTFANQISLMEQFPEYHFFQSSMYHLDLIKKNYPKLFDMIKTKNKEKRYEINGAAWVECDCNITSGEYMIRQMLWGQKYMKTNFGTLSNCYWLPDTFGYSVAIPQIMKGCRVKYFLTQKLSWNDTNRFPYETFYWEGLDGTKVFSHFHVIHARPDPQTLIGSFSNNANKNSVHRKNVSNKRVFAFGFGDGGGGPQGEMIEQVSRLKDLEGCPKTKYVQVSKFMEEIEREAVNVPVYQGDLYLEIHRGTYTNMHNIKRNNRKAEILLHDLEYLMVRKALANKKKISTQSVKELTNTLLVNQFHDILPGTSIPEVHDQSIMETDKLIKEAQKIINNLYPSNKKNESITFINTLSFKRSEIVHLLDLCDLKPEDDEIKIQKYINLDGKKMVSLGPINIGAFGSKVMSLKKGEERQNDLESSFEYDGTVLKTPFTIIKFAENKTIDSYYDIEAKRQLRGKGHPLNTFIIAEDIPEKWDSWDIDADIEYKYTDASKLIYSKIITNGFLEFRLRNKYQIEKNSYITQDMIFYYNTPRIDFETEIEWNSKHRFLKVDFDTTIRSKFAKCEIQFGYVNRPTTRNNKIEKAMFEVVNHKYTDLSEPRYGIAILNDSKYGVSVKDSKVSLSLHKGGCNPDPRGDIGIHKCIYSFLPHNCGFNSENVIHPSYSLNVPIKAIYDDIKMEGLIDVDASNIIIETIKPCEDYQKAFICRMYEAEGSYTNSKITLGFKPNSIYITDMLEENLEKIPVANEFLLTFRAFEIKTIKIMYR